MENKNKPEKKFRASPVTATIWSNDATNKAGEPVTFNTITLERTYKDKEGNFKSTGSLRVTDLPKASLVLSKAYEYLTLKTDEVSSEQQNTSEDSDDIF